MLSFPNIRPTARSYQPPEFAIANPQFVGSIAYPRLLASKPAKAKLSLDFTNIPDAEAALIIAAYMNTLSGLLPIQLPNQIVAGIEDQSLADKIKTADHLKWYFESQPTQSSVVSGVSSVQVELIADID